MAYIWAVPATEPAVPFDPTLAAIRFGTGLSPRIAPPASAAEMMERLRGPDVAAEAWPIPTYDSLRAHLETVRAARKAVIGVRQVGGPALAEADSQLNQLLRQDRSARLRE